MYIFKRFNWLIIFIKIKIKKKKFTIYTHPDIISKHAAHWLKQHAQRVQHQSAWMESFHFCLPDSPFPTLSKFGSSSFCSTTKSDCSFGSSLTVHSSWSAEISVIDSVADIVIRDTAGSLADKTSSCLFKDVIEIDPISTGLSCGGTISVCWVIVQWFSK